MSSSFLISCQADQAFNPLNTVVSACVYAPAAAADICMHDGRAERIEDKQRTLSPPEEAHTHRRDTASQKDRNGLEPFAHMSKIHEY